MCQLTKQTATEGWKHRGNDGEGWPTLWFAQQHPTLRPLLGDGWKISFANQHTVYKIEVSWMTVLMSLNSYSLILKIKTIAWLLPMKNFITKSLVRKWRNSLFGALGMNIIMLNMLIYRFILLLKLLMLRSLHLEFYL